MESGINSEDDQGSFYLVVRMGRVEEIHALRAGFPKIRGGRKTPDCELLVRYPCSPFEREAG